MIGSEHKEYILFQIGDLLKKINKKGTEIGVRGDYIADNQVASCLVNRHHPGKEVRQKAAKDLDRYFDYHFYSFLVKAQTALMKDDLDLLIEVREQVNGFILNMLQWTDYCVASTYWISELACMLDLYTLGEDGSPQPG